jgi:aminomethyltransferase
MLALQGPRWAEALRPLAATPLAFSLDYFEIGEDVIAGVPCLIARTGYTGEPGVELMCPWDGAPALWDALQGVEAAPAPAGLVARDTLRIEMGYPLYGQELTRGRTPIEAGLKWACDLAGGGFAGADVMRRQAEEGTPERLAIFRLTEPGIPRAGQPVLVDGAPAGSVTSGTLSPVLDEGIGMAYVPAAVAGPDNDLVIDVRGKHKAARTARRPLVDTSPKE